MKIIIYTNKVILFIVLFIFSCNNKKDKIHTSTYTLQELNIEDSVYKLSSEYTLEIIKENGKDSLLLLNHIKTLNDSAILLKNKFEKYRAFKDSLSEILFFQIFPDDFNKFVSLYGYNESNQNLKLGPLYDHYEHILNYAPKYINKKDYIRKLINICKNGYWQSDNVSHLQKRIIDLFIESPDLFISLLKENKEPCINSFWKFFFDSPHPNNNQELYDNVLKIVSQFDINMTPIIEKSYQENIEKWEDE